MAAFPVRTELADTYPNPTNAVFRTGIGKMFDALVGLLGTDGTVETALATLGLLDNKAIYNLSPVFTFASNVLTMTLKNRSGGTLTTTAAAFVGQRSSTLSDGGYNLRKISADVSVSISAGSTVGLTSAVAGWIHYYVIDNANVPEAAFSGSFFGFSGRVTTTAEGGAGAADSGTVMYSATARTNVPFRWIGAAKAVHSSGSWTANPSEIRPASEVPFDQLLEETTPDVAADFVTTFDFSTGTFRKLLLNKLVPAAASDTVAGVLELATQPEVNAMTDALRALTPNHNKIILMTEVPTTSGTSIDITGIPAGVRRITIMFAGVSTNTPGTSNYLVQIGDSGGIETTGYVSGADQSATLATSAAGFVVTASTTAASAYRGAVVLDLEDAAGFTWVSRGTLSRSSDGSAQNSAGEKSLSAELDRIRLTTAGGSDVFDLGAINVTYER